MVDAVPPAQPHAAGAEPPPVQKYPGVHAPQPQVADEVAPTADAYVPPAQEHVAACADPPPQCVPATQDAHPQPASEATPVAVAAVPVAHPQPTGVGVFPGQ